MIETSFTVTVQLKDAKYCNGCKCINRTPNGFFCNELQQELVSRDDDKIVRLNDCKEINDDNYKTEGIPQQD